ncbi:MAG: choice-of-anchor Q domain-containing protein, partial [Chloroflexota bacterium]
WTGHAQATHYLLEVRKADDTVVLWKWYTSSQAGCAGGSACSLTPTELTGLANGSYKWRIRDYGAYGYGPFTPFMNFALNVTPVCTNVIYVDADSTASSPDGCSWATAYQNLQDALAAAISGKQIWVARGIYYPDRGGGQTLGDRNASFVLKEGVAIYGGFNGNEANLTDRDKNPATNGTILSGNIGTASVTDNSYQVVQGSNLSASAVLDGFTITGGYSNGSSGHGGGMYLASSSPTLANLLISNNYAVANGGGMYVTSPNSIPEPSYSRPTLTDVTFSANTAARGGGLFTQNGSPALTRVVFTGNIATSGAGGGMNNQTLTTSDAPSRPSLTDVTFSGNIANGGGGMYNNNANSILNRVTFVNNTANRRGGGMLNEGASPSLTNVTFYGNVSNESVGGAPWGGGGMMNVTSSPILNHVTFSGNNSVNASGTAGGDAIRNAVNSNPVIRNSIFWGDLNDEITSDGTGSTTISYSVVQGGFAGGTNIITTDPKLGALANNGGFTQTMALGAGSSAWNAAENSTCAATDQRSVSRPHGLICDIGAYEVNTVLTISPSGTLTTWDRAFRWTGLNSATHFLLEVRKADDTIVLWKWYTVDALGCAGGAGCTIIPSETTNLANGNYKWRVRDYGAYGYGSFTPYVNFTLEIACYSLATSVNPSAGGVVTASAQNCAGGYTAGSVVQVSVTPNIGYVFTGWSGDASGTATTVSVTMGGNKSVTANLRGNTLVAPSGTLTTWSNVFSWTGHAQATHYLLEVRKADDTVVLWKWYTSSQAGCAGGSACSLSPAELTGLANGSYKWRIRDYGVYGYGPFTPYMNFTIP